MHAVGSEDVTLRGEETTHPGRLVERAPARLDRFGRFVVLEPLGSGGSGSVHRAYDPQLDRSVAVKVLHARGATLRLLAEARAMAKLRHPNVVTVYDVGEADDRVWLAMEYVEGGTLRAWLDEVKRSQAEILAVFRKAGAGLVAAHAEGLVHRDFKPDNVLMHAQDRPAVTDFGLAVMDDTQQRDDGDATTSSGLPKPIVGTLAYMSPEQVSGATVGPGSDQFSFGVALYEALCGRRPSGANGRGLEFPSSPKVPAWLRRVVARMLEHDVTDRYPTMRDVVAALEHRAARRLVSAPAVLLLAAVPVVGAMFTASPDPSCDTALDRVHSVWAAQRRASIEDAAARAELVLPVSLLPRVYGELDAWAQSWAMTVDESCEATHVLGSQSEQQLDVRTRCLDLQLKQLDAFVLELETGDAEVLWQAQEAVEQLPRPSDCDDPFELRVPTPQELEAWSWYAKASVRDGLGRFESGLDAVERGLEALGDSPSAARTALKTVESQLARRDGQHERAEAAGRAAVLTDLDLAGPRLAAEAWLELTTTVGVDLAQSQRAEGFLLAAESVVRAMDDVRYEQRLEAVRGAVLLESGRVDEALKALRAAADRAAFSSNPAETSVHLHNYAVALIASGRPEDGLAALDEVLELDQEIRSAGHPVFVRVHQNRALALTSAGHTAQAMDELGLALEAARVSFGPESPRLGALHLNLGVVQIDAGQHKAARQSLQRAIELWAASYPASHPYFESAQTNLGIVANELGEHERALEHYRAAKAAALERQGPKGLAIAVLLGNEANTLRDLGRYAESVEAGREALAIEEAFSGPDAPGLAYALVGLARSLAAMGEHAQALAAAQRARRLRDSAQSSPTELYSVYITLATTLAKAEPGRVAEAREWARAAAQSFEKTNRPPEDAKELRIFESAYSPP